jgi:hypothetical protein
MPARSVKACAVSPFHAELPALAEQFAVSADCLTGEEN